MATGARRVIIGNTVVAERDGEDIVIRYRAGNRERTYTITPAPGTRITVKMGGRTEEIPLVPTLALAAA